MNKRIKELVKKAGLDDPMCPIDEWDNPELEKFAELIVKECIQTIQLGITRDGQQTEKFQRSIKHINDIKQHFGVEE